MAGKTPAGGTPPPSTEDDDSADWASALDEWDAQLDDAFGAAESSPVAKPVETISTEVSLQALSSEASGALVVAPSADEPLEAPLAIDEPLPLDEPPPLDGFALEADTGPQQLLEDAAGGEDMLRDLFEGEALDSPELTASSVGGPEAEPAAELAAESPFDAGGETTGVFNPQASRKELIPPPAPSYEDEDDLEISVELSSALEQAAEAADVTVAAAPPQATAVDEDFYDTIAIVPGRDEPSTPKPTPAPPRVEEVDEPLWSEPTLAVERDDDDPDRTPLPIADEVPGAVMAARVPVPAAPRVQRELVARRPTRPEGLVALASISEGAGSVVLSTDDRRSFLGLVDTERLLAESSRAPALGFEAARLCRTLGDLAGAGERLRVGPPGRARAPGRALDRAPARDRRRRSRAGGGAERSCATRRCGARTKRPGGARCGAG